MSRNPALPPKRAASAWQAELGNAAIAILPVVAVLFSGGLATTPNLAPWYAGLAKPGFNPPNWIFGPVWTALYALMAIACWRVLRVPGHRRARGIALALYFSQLALNAAWSWLFFGLQRPLAGLLDIVPQWGLILATIYHFRLLDRLAAACLVPLAAWVGFACVLNFEIWRLNG